MRGSKLAKIFLFCGLVGFLFFLGTSPARAVCPICVVAVGAGIGFSRWLAIDDLIIGLWIGGLIVSLIIWLLAWLDRKRIFFPFRRLITTLVFYLMVFWSLYFAGMISSPFGQDDRLLYGILTGSLVFVFGFWLYHFLKKRNQGRSFFPFQKVVLPASGLLILSLIIHFFI